MNATALLKRIRLNGRVIRLILANKWLTKADYGVSYDQLAPQYEANWLCHLRSVTDILLQHIPEREYRSILDLGCGTGYTTDYLAQKYSTASIIGVDISSGMLQEARKKSSHAHVHWQQGDMLEFLHTRPSGSSDLILSAWAIGYSAPSDVIRQASHVLTSSGGVVAFVVNFLDTLGPVFQTFRECMRAFPEKVGCLVMPRYPRSWTQLQQTLEQAGFQVVFHQEGQQLIREYFQPDAPVLPWLLHTGVLAGFDQMLPFHKDPRLCEFFEQRIRQTDGRLFHHYIMVIGEKL
jgi:trans-aconitate methyltransferase